MTHVGKILVIFIMGFSILFLGLTTVVFTTHTNWKQAYDKESGKVKDLTTKNNTLTSEVGVAKADLDKTKADHKAATDASEKRISSLDEDIKRTQDEISDIRKKIEVAQKNAEISLGEAKQRLEETSLIREQKSAVEKQANEFKIQQTELLEKIRELERLNKTIDDNNKDLRDRVARFSSLLRLNGLSDDISNIKGLESPPPVEGVVEKVDSLNKKLEISIGSDDGLVVGHDLFLYRTSPRAEYLGKVKIISVDPDRAVAKVIGNTIQGKKIQEGDIVSSTIRPRS
jgi:hypothetical protein